MNTPISLYLDPLKSRITRLERMMEEMANAPKEEMGKRQPGERNAYEINNIEVAFERWKAKNENN